MNKKKGILRNAAEGYFAAFALANIGQIAAVDIISLVLFLMCFQLFLFAERKETESALSADGKKLVKGYSSRNRRVASVILGILFAFFYLAAEHGSLTGALENRLFQMIYLLMTGAGLFFLFYRGCRLLLLYLERRSLRISSIPVSTDSPEPALSLQTKLFLFLLLIACWLPWFLYDFPGVMTPDSLSQYSQAMGLTGYSNHHPFVHTLLIRLFVSLGNAVFHNVYAGIACYTVFQMIAMAVIVVSCISVLIRRRAGKKLCFCFLLFYALVPYNGILQLRCGRIFCSRACFCCLYYVFTGFFLFIGREGRFIRSLCFTFLFCYGEYWPA